MAGINLESLNQEELKALQQALTPKLNKYIPYTPTPKQSAFLLMNHVKEVMYGGSAGGGKSVAQLMAALQFVDIPGYSAILFRKTYADLSLPGALMDMSRQWLTPFLNTGEVKWQEKDKRYTFPSGAKLSFGYLETEADKYRYQGAEFQYIGIDEVTHISQGNFTYLFSRLRKPKSLPVPLRFRSTANPGGEHGEYYYNRYFVEGAEKGRVFIGAGIYDNPHLDTDSYIESLSELSAIERAQLLDGNWEIKQTGSMFNKDWFEIVDKSSIPPVARCVRTWDFASTDPTTKRRKRNRDPDFTASMKVWHHQGIYWIEDIDRVQKSPYDVEQLVATRAHEDGTSVDIRAEQEPGSSGQMAIDFLARDALNGYPFKGVTSTGSKSERAKPASSAAEGGRILICRGCKHINDFLNEAEMFPQGVHDDMVDCLSLAVSHFKKNVVFSPPSGVRKAGGSYWGRL